MCGDEIIGKTHWYYDFSGLFDVVAFVGFNISICGIWNQNKKHIGDIKSISEVIAIKGTGNYTEQTLSYGESCKCGKQWILAPSKSPQLMII